MLLLNHVRIIDLDVTPIEYPEPMTLYYGSRGSSDVLEVYVCFQDGILRKLGGASTPAPFIEVYGRPIIDSSGTVNNYLTDMIVPAPFTEQCNGIDFVMKPGQVISLSGVVNAAGCRNRNPEHLYIATSWNVDVTLLCDRDGQISVFNKTITAASSPMDGTVGNFWDFDINVQQAYEPTPEEQQNGFQSLEPLFSFRLNGGPGVWQSNYADLEITGKMLFTVSNARQFLLE